MSTEAAKPGSWIKVPDTKTERKRPFVLRPHLTDHPLRDNPQLSELSKSLKKGNKK